MIYVGSEKPNGKGLCFSLSLFLSLSSRHLQRAAVKGDKSCVRLSSRCFCQTSTHVISRFCEAKQGPSTTRMYGRSCTQRNVIYRRANERNLHLLTRFDDDDMWMTVMVSSQYQDSISRRKLYGRCRILRDDLKIIHLPQGSVK